MLCCTALSYAVLLHAFELLYRAQEALFSRAATCWIVALLGCLWRASFAACLGTWLTAPCLPDYQSCFTHLPAALPPASHRSNLRGTGHGGRAVLSHRALGLCGASRGQPSRGGVTNRHGQRGRWRGQHPPSRLVRAQLARAGRLHIWIPGGAFADLALAVFFRHECGWGAGVCHVSMDWPCCWRTAPAWGSCLSTGTAICTGQRRHCHHAPPHSLVNIRKCF